MTNTVYYEGKERKELRLRAKDMVGGNFDPAKTAFIGHIIDYITRLPLITKLYLVNHRSVFDAEDPRITYVDTKPFVVERWVDVEIHVKE